MAVTARRLARSVGKIRNVLVVLVAVIAGVSYPMGAQYVQPVTVLIVTLLIYSSLRGVRISRRRLTPSLGSIGIVVALTYLVIPVVGIAWSRLYLTGDSLLGAAIVLSAPSTAGSAIVWTRLAGGNEELSGITSIATITLAPLLTPIVLLWAVGHIQSLPIVELGTNLLLVTAAAIALRVLVPDEALGDTVVKYGSVVAIMLLIYAGVATAGLAGTRLLLAAEIGLLVLVVFVVGLLGVLLLRAVSGRGRDELLSMFFSATLKNLGISLFIVLSIGSTIAVHAIIVYYVSQQLFSALLVEGLIDRFRAIAVGRR